MNDKLRIRHEPYDALVKELADAHDEEMSRLWIRLEADPSRKNLSKARGAVCGETDIAIEAAFRIGYQCGRNPELLLFEHESVDSGS